MKTKIVLWGTNEQDERILIALQLRTQDNKVDIFTFPENIVTEAFYNQMMDDWRDGKECPFPEGFQQSERDLSATESLLPDELKVERGDLIQRAQTEWHFVVLSSKLSEIYQSELGELKEKIEGLTTFESGLWDELKDFWKKVQEQIRERNLFREHANSLRQSTNSLFDHLKKLRSALDDEFKNQSKVFYDQFMTTLSGVEEKVEKGLNLQSIFNELRNIQREFKDTKLTREHRSKVWNKLDRMFKVVKEKRFGSEALAGNSPMDRLKKRYDGLLGAIERMENSLKRDDNDLAFQERRIENSDGQLEAQIRVAKIKMIEERIKSKKVKLEDMLKTKSELETKMAAQAERDRKATERKKEQAAKQAAKKAAKEKIAAKIKEDQQAREGEAADLEKAAEAITSGSTTTPEKQPETLLTAVGVTLGEALEDVVDTVRAVAEVVSEKVGDAFEELKEAAEKDQPTPPANEEQ